jgi:hypothetical protein
MALAKLPRVAHFARRRRASEKCRWRPVALTIQSPARGCLTCSWVSDLLKEPSTIGLPPALDDVHGIPDAHVGLNTGVPEVVERSSQSTVFMARYYLFPDGRVSSYFGCYGCSLVLTARGRRIHG